MCLSLFLVSSIFSSTHQVLGYCSSSFRLHSSRRLFLSPSIMASSLCTVVCVGRHNLLALQIHHSMHQAQRYPVESVILILVTEVFSAQLWQLWQFGAVMDQASLFTVHYCEASKGYLTPSWSLPLGYLALMPTMAKSRDSECSVSLLGRNPLWNCFCGCFTIQRGCVSNGGSSSEYSGVPCQILREDHWNEWLLFINQCIREVSGTDDWVTTFTDFCASLSTNHSLTHSGRASNLPSYPEFSCFFFVRIALRYWAITMTGIEIPLKIRVF